MRPEARRKRRVPVAQTNASIGLVQQLTDELQAIQDQYCQVLTASVEYFRHSENPPQDLVDRSEELRCRLQALRTEIRELAGGR